MLKKIWFAVVEGLKTGALTYLIVLALQLQPTPVTPKNIISLLIMSALIGLVSLVFEVDRFSPLVNLILHFCGVSFLVSLGMLYNGWSIWTLTFWCNFIGSYLLIWLFVRLNIFIKTRKINAKLSELHQSELP